MRGSVWKRIWRIQLTRLAALALVVMASVGASERDDGDGRLSLSDLVACKEIIGYEDYVPLEPVELTADDKLLIYYRPQHFKSSRSGEKYKAHLTQDGRMRRKGEKRTLWSKPKMVDYEVETNRPPDLLYIRNTVSLKGLSPGEYEFEIVLHDEIGQGTPAIRSLPFRVIPASDPKPTKDGPPVPVEPAGRR